MPRYRAFGTIFECDLPLAALEGARVAADRSEASPVRVELRGSEEPCIAREDETEWHRIAEDGRHVLRITVDSAGNFRFRYADGTCFVIAADGGSVRGNWPTTLSLEDTLEYLLGPVIGFALRLRGVVCLHASAVAVDGGSFAFLAPAGHGKSTTAAACARLGMAVLTDDVLALSERDGCFLALPSYPRVRLWPEAVGDLFGSSDALPRLTPGNESWDKRYLDLREPGYAFHEQPSPLRCIYTPAPADDSETSLEPLPPAQALVTLIGNVYTRSRPETAQRRREFELLERLVRTVPVKRLRRRHGVEHLASQCRAMAQDCASGGTSPPGASGP